MLGPSMFMGLSCVKQTSSPPHLIYHSCCCVGRGSKMLGTYVTTQMEINLLREADVFSPSPMVGLIKAGAPCRKHH